MQNKNQFSDTHTSSPSDGQGTKQARPQIDPTQVNRLNTDLIHKPYKKGVTKLTEVEQKHYHKLYKAKMNCLSYLFYVVKSLRTNMKYKI